MLLLLVVSLVILFIVVVFEELCQIFAFFVLWGKKQAACACVYECVVIERIELI